MTPEQFREQRRQAVRKQIDEMGLTLTTCPNGLFHVTGRGLDIRAKDLAAISDRDLSSMADW